MRRVAVTGIGVVAPHGNDPRTLFERLVNGESAVRGVPVKRTFPVIAASPFAPAITL